MVYKGFESSQHCSYTSYRFIFRAQLIPTRCVWKLSLRAKVWLYEATLYNLSLLNCYEKNSKGIRNIVFSGIIWGHDKKKGNN